MSAAAARRPSPVAPGRASAGHGRVFLSAFVTLFQYLFSCRQEQQSARSDASPLPELGQFTAHQLLGARSSWLMQPPANAAAPAAQPVGSWVGTAANPLCAQKAALVAA